MEAYEAIAQMEGIWLFLWSDALPTARSLKSTRALLLRAARTPIDHLLPAAEGARDFNSQCITQTG
jgi:hypothetical protein